MPDAALCRDATCPHRGECLRYLSRPTFHRIAGEFVEVQTYLQRSPLGPRGACAKRWPIFGAMPERLRTLAEADADNTTE